MHTRPLAHIHPLKSISTTRLSNIQQSCRVSSSAFRNYSLIQPRKSYFGTKTGTSRLSLRRISPLPLLSKVSALSCSSSSISNMTMAENATPTPPAAEKVTAWASAGPAAFDFRSDVVTTPTQSMLSAITSTTLLDDVFLEDPTTLSLEKFISELTGHEAALLVLSGTMGNQIALRTHLAGPPHSILTDKRSHIVQWEAGGAAAMCGAFVNGVLPRNGRYLTLEEIQEEAELSDDVHLCPTKLISLENTLNGVVMPLDECQKISAWARGKGIPVHCDGARLWEACAALAVQGFGEPVSLLKEYAKCFDSISLCFSKGLGAPIGSILVGSQPFIKRARHIRKSIGGGLRQAGVVAAPARVAVEETFLGGKLVAAQARARRIAGIWISMGGQLAEPVDTNMVWLGSRGKVGGLDGDQLVAVAAEEGVRLSGGRLVVHYQISDEAEMRLKRVMERVIKGDKARARVGGDVMDGLKVDVE